MVETSDEWITTRTGIKERRIAARDEFTSDMAAKAALLAMKMAGVTASQIDLIIIATVTPDMPFPSTACLVQHKIGAKKAAAFDLEAACSVSSTASRSQSSSSSRIPTTRCWWSARKRFQPSPTGKTGTPACCSATAQVRQFCSIVRARKDC